ncbi:hypothetical protein B857_02171 [Solibacillus isronensis B3W22]|uniref:Uncharacterized protein n=1 Tax=Solibacillus isronensis B3W22 TaxID=1224748 RepID=K1LL78_9BACL|nr:hypothetical protein B857_02171 [Solibacillus isronensis B3W22]
MLLTELNQMIEYIEDDLTNDLSLYPCTKAEQA